MKTFRRVDIEKAAKAIEADAGQAPFGLRDFLAEVKARTFVGMHTLEKIAKQHIETPGRS